MAQRPGLLDRKLIFVHGKGGVGKTVVSQAIARALAAKGRRTLWVAFEDPTRPPGEKRSLGPNLDALNCEAHAAFEEYVGLKIRVAALTRIFLQNRVMRYLSKAAPGIHDLVLIGKVWHERESYDHVVADMPSTGYGIAMFQSTENFARLFQGGPIHRDALSMITTFGDPELTGQLVVSLPEEMPLQESLELADHLKRFFPANPPLFAVNRRFPRCADAARAEGIPADPERWPSPFARDTLDFARKRALLEESNLRLWRENEIRFSEFEYVAPPAREAHEAVVNALAREVGPVFAQELRP